MDFQVVFECENCKNEVELEFYDEKSGVCKACFCASNFDKMYISGKFLVLSIDIGIKHLALVLSNINEKYEFENIVWFDLVDITIFKCKPGCAFFHTSTFADWIRHFIDNYEFILTKADRILIERQPPQGLTVVEQLLFGCFREKSILIAPNSVHKFFGIGHFDYEQRKIASVNLTKNYFTHQLLTQLNGNVRKHDIADAMLFTIFWIRKQKDLMDAEILRKNRELAMNKFNKNIGMSLNDWFDVYRYIPPKNV
jgi:hypothetical protein